MSIMTVLYAYGAIVVFVSIGAVRIFVHYRCFTHAEQCAHTARKTP